MLKAYTWLTFCVVMWGSNFVFGKILVQHFSPTLLTLLRLLFIVILLLGIAFYQKHLKRVNKMDLLAIIFLGIVGVFINQWSFLDRKSTRLNSSHVAISYAVFCLKNTTF